MHFLNALRAADCRRRSVECTDVQFKRYDIACTRNYYCHYYIAITGNAEHFHTDVMYLTVPVQSPITQCSYYIVFECDNNNLIITAVTNK